MPQPLTWDSMGTVVTGHRPTRSHTVVTTVHVGNFPAAVATNPLTNTIYVANQGDSTMSVIRG